LLGRVSLAYSCDGHAGPLARVRDGRVVDEHVEAAKLLRMRSAAAAIEALIRHVELERARVSADRPGRLFAAREVARTDQDGEALRGELFAI
jgi:hypothetical protein